MRNCWKHHLVCGPCIKEKQALSSSIKSFFTLIQPQLLQNLVNMHVLYLSYNYNMPSWRRQYNIILNLFPKLCYILSGDWMRSGERVAMLGQCIPLTLETLIIPPPPHSCSSQNSRHLSCLHYNPNILAWCIKLWFQAKGGTAFVSLDG
jgi:hypothetical protein